MIQAGWVAAAYCPDCIHADGADDSCDRVPALVRQCKTLHHDAGASGAASHRQKAPNLTLRLFTRICSVIRKGATDFSGTPSWSTLAMAERVLQVRNSAGGIVQLAYGDDGLDPLTMEGAANGQALNLKRLISVVRSRAGAGPARMALPDELRSAACEVLQQAGAGLTRCRGCLPW